MLVIKYSCVQCGIRLREVKVPIRAEGEDVVHWVEQTVGHSIMDDHSRTSPYCKAVGVQDVMIPLTGARHIGGPCVQ